MATVLSTETAEIGISSSAVEEEMPVSSVIPSPPATEITITEYPNLPSFLPIYVSIRLAMNLETFEANKQEFKDNIAAYLNDNFNETFSNESVIIMNISRIATTNQRAGNDEVIVNFYITNDFAARSVNPTLTKFIGNWLLKLFQDRNDALLGPAFSGKLLQVSLILSNRVADGVVIAVTLSAFAAAILLIAFLYWRSSQTNSQMDKSVLAERLRSGSALRLEFDEIPTMVSSNAELPANIERKNRFINVVPNKLSRVNLRPILGDVTSEYINANYVRGYLGKPRSYIATQAPLTNTVTDFWRMIWENNVKVILMATALDINGSSQCSQYWPLDDEVGASIKADSFLITLHDRVIYDTYIISTLNLQNNKRESIYIKHYWYTKWPADNFPSDEESTVNLLLNIREELKELDSPLVVHCNNGIGRTGVLLAVDTCMRSYDDCRKVDIKKCVERVREDRGGCVQTFDQYLYIYKGSLRIWKSAAMEEQ
ncbi:uncharacterized protein TRIADDRAFT_60483 [Trichoplax adhaerens]|uniref:protein-tyrosine-phosphatase n=1 Tax=Trichoplax adhaerens TaxID=10228 RepID=B3S8C0_TRIAD|nr:hypothetical protein TRIADDRAFT_60483 [Trichoplax adhaerens]EDV21074.1 hypothetical protein TRIADDRAFT_60483 [Trichoplax adhaerens]|eukprot:XP_002116404.1 hypothetical protein TRIADDRAFT_60483 [Trichoplax adhaerens]